MFKKLIIPIICILITFCAILSISACGTAKYEQDIDYLYKEIAALRKDIDGIKEMLGLPEYDFDDDTVVVEIKEEFQDKNFTVDDFAMIEVVKIELLVKPNIYTLEIANKGKRNVLEAIEKLKSVEFVKESYPSFNVPVTQ